MDITEGIVIVVAATIAAIPGINASWNQRKKNSAEAAEKIQQSAVNLIEPLNKRIQELEERVLALEKENVKLRSENEKHKELKAGAEKLYYQVKSHGGVPVFKLAEWDNNGD